MPNERPSPPALLWLLMVIVGAEAALVAIGAVYSIVSIPGAAASELATGVALTGVAILITVGLVFVVLGLYRLRGWARSGAITWQVLQGALAIGCFQGLLAVPAVGWALLLPAVAGFVLALSPPVVRATRRD